MNTPPSPPARSGFGILGLSALAALLTVSFAVAQDEAEPDGGSTASEAAAENVSDSAESSAQAEGAPALGGAASGGESPSAPSDEPALEIDDTRTELGSGAQSTSQPAEGPVTSSTLEPEAMGELDTAVVQGAGPSAARRPAPVPRTPVTRQTVEVATRTEKPIEDVAPAVGVIDENEIARIAPRSFDDLIRKEPNVETLGGPRYLGEQLVVRGEGGNAVTVRIDDARQNFVSGHTGQRFFLDPHFLKGAEILRGVGSFLYGSGSAGVVSLSTLDPGDIIRDDSFYGLRLRNTYNDNSKEWAHSLIGAVSAETLSLMIGTVDREGENITLADDMELPNSAIERQSDLAKLVWTPHEEHRFELSVNTYESLDQGGANPQGDIGPANARVGRQIDYMQWYGNYQFDPVDNDLVQIDTTFYYNQTTQVRDYLAAAGNNAGRQNVHDLDVFGIDFTNRSEVIIGNREHEIVFGIDAFTETQDGEETRGTFFIPGAPGNSSGRPDAEADHFGLFLTDEVDLTDSFTLFSGLRYDSYRTLETVGDSAAQDDGQLSPNIGFDYDIDEHFSLVGRYSKAFTEPTLNQLYQDGSHFGIVPDEPFVQTLRPPQGGFFLPPPFGSGAPPPGLTRFNYFEEVFVPNPNLLPETSDNFELGINYENDDVAGGELSARLTGFYKRGENTFDSEIAGTRTRAPFDGFANPDDVPPETVPSPFGPFGPPSATVFTGIDFEGQLTRALRQTVNREETEIYGMEFSLDYDADTWFAALDAGALRGQDITTGMQLNTITGDQVSLTAGIRPLESVELGGYGIWNAGREDRVTDPFLQTGGYDIYGLFATFQATENWTLRFGVDNLFDRAYARTNVLQEEPGRNVSVSSTIHW